ncbi:MAG: sugar ABC transporter permease, partial [Paludibacteraceae bacterium]|nr:sugar ABC transporter permease [Paludibacteraceae bacterium]
MSKKKLQSFKLFLMVLPFIILVLVFSYYPLYGWMYAFYDYKPPRSLADSQFVGFKWFQSLVSSKTKLEQIGQVLKNTFAMSGITIATSWLPMIFAVFLNEIRNNKFRKVIQTMTTLPNFVSWVMVYSIAFSLFNSTRMLNSLLIKMGVISDPVLFLQQSNHVWLTQWLWLTWKNLGWAAIMYVAAISGIDDEMIEAARVDGATRMQVIRHIT